VGISYTACDVPYWGLIGSAFPDTTERTGVISQVRAYGGISLGIATLGMPWLAKLMSGGGDATATGWSLAVGISAFVGMTLYLLAFVNTREKARPDTGERLTLRVLFTTLGKNTPLLLVLLGRSSASVATSYKRAGRCSSSSPTEARRPSPSSAPPSSSAWCWRRSARRCS